jgi:hypothetical protein
MAQDEQGWFSTHFFYQQFFLLFAFVYVRPSAMQLEYYIFYFLTEDSLLMSLFYYCISNSYIPSNLQKPYQEFWAAIGLKIWRK